MVAEMIHYTYHQWLLEWVVCAALPFNQFSVDRYTMLSMFISLAMFQQIVMLFSLALSQA